MSSSYSENELRNMQIAAKISACTSILGSGYIIVEILHKKHWFQQFFTKGINNCSGCRKRRTNNVHANHNHHHHHPTSSQHRPTASRMDSFGPSLQQQKRSTLQNILLGMCVFDGISSIWTFIGSWAIPEGTEGVFQPHGTAATCAVQGFAIQLMQALPMYNLMLALYFWLVINAHCRDDVLRQHQYAFHILPVGFGIATASWGVAADQFDNATLWCWFAGQPHSDTFRLALFYGPVWAAMGMAIFLLYSVYRNVRQQEHRVQRDMEKANQRMLRIQQKERQQQQQQQRFVFSSDMVSSSHVPPSSILGGATSSFHQQHQQQQQQQSKVAISSAIIMEHESRLADQQTQNLQEGCHTSDANGQSQKDDVMDEEGSACHVENTHEKYTTSTIANKQHDASPAIQKAQQGEQSCHDDHTKSSTEDTPNDRGENSLSSKQYPTVAPEIKRNQKTFLRQKAARYSKTVFWQGFWYAAAFALTYSFATMVRVMESLGQTVPHELFVLMCLTLPGQGFLNLLVYKRVAVARCYRRLRHRLRPPQPPPRRYPKTRMEEEARRMEQEQSMPPLTRMNLEEVLSDDEMVVADDEDYDKSDRHFDFMETDLEECS